MDQDNKSFLENLGWICKENGGFKDFVFQNKETYIINPLSHDIFFSENEALMMTSILKNYYFQKYGIISLNLLHGKKQDVFSYEEYKDKSVDFHRNNKFLAEILSNNSNIKLHETFFYLSNKKLPCGYFVAKDIILISYGLPPLLHEIAHIIEMSDYTRLTKVDMGMPTDARKMSDKGFLCAIARESRVRAIQSIIGDRPMKLFDNPSWVAMVKEKQTLGKFKTFKEILEWSDVIYNNALEEWTLDKIKEEWFKKMNFIQNWMDQQSEIKIGDINEIAL